MIFNLKCICSHPHTPAPWHFDMSATFPQDFHRFNFFTLPPCLYSSNISEIMLYTLRSLWPPAVPRLAARPSQSNPGGLGQRYWSVSEVTWPPKLDFWRWGSSGPSSLINPQIVILTWANIRCLGCSRLGHYGNLCWAAAGKMSAAFWLYDNSSTGGPAGNLEAVAGSSDPWRCGLANPSMGSRINSAEILPHFAEDDPPVGAFERDRSVYQWIT